MRYTNKREGRDEGKKSREPGNWDLHVFHWNSSPETRPLFPSSQGPPLFVPDYLHDWLHEPEVETLLGSAEIPELVLLLELATGLSSGAQVARYWWSHPLVHLLYLVRSTSPAAT